jgi:beta-glucanase (GH16 family)
MDGVPHLEFDNNDSTPFQEDFFIILNVAMGGTLGGNIADDFQESSMEVDYVKVFQE